MKIATIGSGNVGGGLAGFWEKAGHEVERIGREGGDASGADAVLLAVPSAATAAALGKVSGLEGRVLVDATNFIGDGERPGGLDSLSAYVKQLTGAHVAKAFNTVFARIYDQVAAQDVPPGCLYCGEEEAKETTARLIRDAGYEPVDAGGLESARALEDFLKLEFAVSGAGLGPFFYRIAGP
jgi:8-hydroxy-5-deazaflavin:NADPH oxidoreductase